MAKTRNRNMRHGMPLTLLHSFAVRRYAARQQHWEERRQNLQKVSEQRKGEKAESD